MEGRAAQADFCFVHFTDTHIIAGGTLHNFDTSASLQRVIAVLNALEPRPAFAVIGGDLVSPDIVDRNRTLTAAEYEPSYRLFQELIRPLQCPTYMLLGNHDHRQAFHQVMQTPVPTLDTPHHYSFDHQGYHFVALDTHQPGQPGGYLDAPQLAWLHADLAASQRSTHHRVSASPSLAPGSGLARCYTPAQWRRTCCCAPAISQRALDDLWSCTPGSGHTTRRPDHADHAGDLCPGVQGVADIQNPSGATRLSCRVYQRRRVFHPRPASTWRRFCNSLVQLSGFPAPNWVLRTAPNCMPPPPPNWRG